VLIEELYLLAFMQRTTQIAWRYIPEEKKKLFSNGIRPTAKASFGKIDILCLGP
jgi:hypothetical protein